MTAFATLGLQAMASMLKSAPSMAFAPASCSNSSGIVSCAQLPSATACRDQQTLARGEGRHQMQRRPSTPPIMVAARCHAVDGHQVRRIGPQRRRPGLEAVANGPGSTGS